MSERRRRLAIGIPIGPTVRDKFFRGWLTLKTHQVDVIPAVGHYTTNAHNFIVREFLKLPGVDRLLLLETDHLFPPNLLERVSYYDAPIVSAVYNLREEPHEMAAYIPQPEYEGSKRVWAGDWSGAQCRFPSPSLQLEWMQRNQLFPVLAVGMGCCSIDREVLEAFPKDEPPFQSPIVNGEIVTDDFWFCRRAAQLGFPIHVDGAVHTPHLGDQLVTVETRLKYLEGEAFKAGLLDPDQAKRHQVRQEILDTIRPRRKRPAER